MGRQQYDDSETSGDLQTIFKLRIPEERARMVRDMIILFLFMLFFFFGFVAFAGLQYWSCYSRDASIGVMECLSGQAARRKR